MLDPCTKLLCMGRECKAKCFTVNVLKLSVRCAGEIYEDALEYPFLSAMLAPFGPDAARPFEAHLRRLHRECNQKHGGCWYKMSSTAKSGAPVGEVLETGTSHGTADGWGPQTFQLNNPLVQIWHLEC